MISYINASIWFKFIKFSKYLSLYFLCKLFVLSQGDKCIFFLFIEVAQPSKFINLLTIFQKKMVLGPVIEVDVTKLVNESKKNEIFILHFVDRK